MNHTSCPRIAHVVYRTRRFDEMLRWYATVFGTRVVTQDPAIVFLGYDEEHHRFAIANLNVIRPGGDGMDNRALVGIDHVAYSLDTLHELFERYAALAEAGIRPYWCVHHGVTVSMYYADPDGNQMEFQVECFGDAEAANAFMAGPGFAQNPIGVEFDPDELLARRREGPVGDFLARAVHQPVSPIRGAFGRSA